MAVYDASETSEYGGSDIRLYEFTRGTFTWYYTNADGQITLGSGSALRVYTPIAISDAGIQQKGEAVTDDFTMTVPSNLPIVLMFLGTPPTDSIKIVMRQMQPGDDEAPIMWLGYLSSVRYKDNITSTMVANTQTASLQRQGLRLGWSRQCIHALYDQGCTVDPMAWREQATITGLAGYSFEFNLAVAAPSKPDGRFSNGYFEWSTNDFWTERRPIQSHTGNGIITLGATDGLTDGLLIWLYPGCQRIPSNCQLFNNIANYGGYPFLPGVSPFDGNPVF